MDLTRLWPQIVARAQKACDRPGWDWRLKRWKFIARAWLTPRLTRRWFAVLDRPELAPLVGQRPRLFGKLQRPYLHRSLRPAGRLKILEDHYEFVASRISPAALAAIAARDGLLLCESVFEDLGPVRLRMLYTDKFEKEGELTVGIYAQEPPRLVTAASFTILRGSGSGWEIFIGGLQANHKADQRELIRDVTKAIFGLRPKAFALWSVQIIASAWKIPLIRGVGDTQHVYRHFQNRKDLSASYDEFWRESEGTPDACGFFVLPSRFTPRLAEELKPNKRRLYQRRYDLLTSLACQVRASLLKAAPTAGKNGEV